MGRDEDSGGSGGGGRTAVSANCVCRWRVQRHGYCGGNSGTGWYLEEDTAVTEVVILVEEYCY